MPWSYDPIPLLGIHSTCVAAHQSHARGHSQQHYVFNSSHWETTQITQMNVNKCRIFLKGPTMQPRDRSDCNAVQQHIWISQTEHWGGGNQVQRAFTVLDQVYEGQIQSKPNYGVTNQDRVTLAEKKGRLLSRMGHGGFWEAGNTVYWSEQ